MPSVLHKPTCLHIPALYEDQAASISWEEVAGAEGYELDCIWDGDFESASKGLAWMDFFTEQLSWSGAQSKDHSWGSLQQLDARGLTWGNLELDAPGWSQIREKALSWQDFSRRRVMFTVYRGPGDNVPGPGQGLVWGNLNALESLWRELELKELSWQQLEALAPRGYTWLDMQPLLLTWAGLEEPNLTWAELQTARLYGLSWANAGSRYLTWEDAHSSDWGWGEFQRLTDDGLHRGWDIQVPMEKKTGQFRLRAFGGAEYSPYLTANPEPVTTFYSRADAIELLAKAGESFCLQLSAVGIPRFGSSVILLTYPKELLELVSVNQQQEYGIGGEEEPSILQVKSNEPGSLRFTCAQEISPGLEWDGLVARLKFTALQTGAAMIRMR